MDQEGAEIDPVFDQLILVILNFIFFKQCAEEENIIW